MAIEYKINQAISGEQFISLLQRSGLAARRPIEDKACVEAMVKHTNLSVTAWQNNELIGIARCLTDFHYACYLSDLAVDSQYQHQGIGKHLQECVHQQLGQHCKLVLVAAPAANSYYKKIGFQNNPRCWILPPGSRIE